MVINQQQVKRGTRKVRQPETDVLPLCNAANLRTWYERLFYVVTGSWEHGVRRT